MKKTIERIVPECFSKHVDDKLWLIEGGSWIFDKTERLTTRNFWKVGGPYKTDEGVDRAQIRLCDEWAGQRNFFIVVAKNAARAKRECMRYMFATRWSGDYEPIVACVTHVIRKQEQCSVCGYVSGSDDGELFAEHNAHIFLRADDERRGFN